MANASDFTFSAFVFASQKAVNAAGPVAVPTHIRDRFGNHVIAQPGDYVIQDEDDLLRVMKGSLFEAEYTAQAAPTAPSGLTRAGGTHVQIDLSWTIGDATALPHIEKDDVEIAVNAANDNTYSATGLTANTGYDFAVRNEKNEAFSARATLTAYTLPADISAAPTLHSGGQLATSIQIDFVPVDSTAETEVHVDDGAGGAFSLFETVAPGVTTSTVTGLTTATTYRFKVRPKGVDSDLTAANFSSILSQITA